MYFRIRRDSHIERLEPTPLLRADVDGISVDVVFVAVQQRAGHDDVGDVVRADFDAVQQRAVGVGADVRVGAEMPFLVSLRI